MYLATCTRPDLAQAVGVLSRFVSDPRQQHWLAAKKVLRYLLGTLNLGLQFGGKDMIGYIDADFAGDLDGRRSTTAYVFVLFGAAVSSSLLWHCPWQRQSMLEIVRWCAWSLEEGWLVHAVRHVCLS
jgi:hypothetical protein